MRPILRVKAAKGVGVAAPVLARLGAGAGVAKPENCWGQRGRRSQAQRGEGILAGLLAGARGVCSWWNGSAALSLRGGQAQCGKGSPWVDGAGLAVVAKSIRTL